mgnify:CR=1 FL=1
MAVLPAGEQSWSPECGLSSNPPEPGISTGRRGASRGRRTVWRQCARRWKVILNVERFRWQIYRPYSGMEWSGLIGQDPGYVPRNCSGASGTL